MRADIQNPFVYESASRLPLEDLLSVYIPDHNYSRFLDSKRNLIILGERGSGKTSTLLHNSVKADILRASDSMKRPDLSILGIYIPGNSAHLAKRDFELLEPRKAWRYAEHYLCSLIATQIVSALDTLDVGPVDESVREDFEYVMGWTLRTDVPVIKALLQHLKRISYEAQTDLTVDEINMPGSPMGFSSTIVYLIRTVRQIHSLENSHFSLMIDDVHDLNDYYRRIINSWISYRHTEEISIKIATAKAAEMIFLTESGGSILEGHDYTLIDLEKPFQASDSNYYKLAKDIVERRLRNTGRANISAEDFFPQSAALTEKLEECDNVARDRFIAKNPDASDRKIQQYVHKFGRADFFRNRAAKANLPAYSGFEVITHLSTGIVRNLLQPCYRMFEDALSRNGMEGVSSIVPRIQDQTIKTLSEELWRRLQEDVALTVRGCTRKQAGHLYNLFNNLAKLFEDRLLHHPSEPRAIVFSVSGTKGELPDELHELFRIGREFQVLYIRRGSAKDEGERENYYVPNRLLWPVRGLDPVGQHARVSLQARDLLKAAYGNPFPRISSQTRDEAPGFFEEEDR